MQTLILCVRGKEKAPNPKAATRRWGRVTDTTRCASATHTWPTGHVHGKEKAPNPKAATRRWGRVTGTTRCASATHTWPAGHVRGKEKAPNPKAATRRWGRVTGTTRCASATHTWPTGHAGLSQPGTNLIWLRPSLQGPAWYAYWVGPCHAGTLGPRQPSHSPSLLHGSCWAVSPLGLLCRPEARSSFLKKNYIVPEILIEFTIIITMLVIRNSQ
jgi:hypothetical protein